MHDVLSALDTADVTTIGIKADLQLSGVTTISGLAEKLVLPAPIDRIVQQLAECGRVVVLIDQVDALSLSLARDQSALAVVLDLVARLRTTKGVRILMTCRTFDRKTDPMLKSIESEQEFVIPELSDSEVQETLYALQMDADALLPATRRFLPRRSISIHLFGLLGTTVRSTALRLRLCKTCSIICGLKLNEGRAGRTIHRHPYCSTSAHDRADGS